MAFDDTLIFPPKISFGATGGPGFLTSVVATSGGKEYRNQSNSQQLCTFNVGHSARSKVLFDIVAKFYWTVRGRLYPFRYWDYTDYNITDNGGVAVFYPLGGTQYQLYKRYSFGSSYYDRKLTKLFGTTTVTGGSGVSVNQNTGIITSTGAPSNCVTQFHVPCRFDIDDAQFQIINKNVQGFIMGWDNIPIKEIRI